MILLAFFIYKGYMEKKKSNIELRLKNEEILQQKEEIRSQRDEIERQKEYAEQQWDHIQGQNKVITDSIRYPETSSVGEICFRLFHTLQTARYCIGRFLLVLRNQRKSGYCNSRLHRAWRAGCIHEHDGNYFDERDCQ